MLKMPYANEAEQTQILQSMSGYPLLEDAIHLDGKYLIFDEPPHSQHIGKVVSIDVTKARPVKVARKWRGTTFNADCLVTQNIVTLYQAGKIQIDDYVIVSFIDEIPDTQEVNLAIVVDKVFKSW